LLALLVIRQRVGISKLAPKIGLNRATVRTALLFLLERGFVTQDQAGEWEATQAARAFLDGLIARSESTAVPLPEQPAHTINPAGELPATGENFSPAAEGDDQNLSITAQNFSPAALKNQAVKDLYKPKKKELKTEDPDLNLTDSHIEQNISPPGQNLSIPDPPVPELDIGRILAATGKLFGEPVLGRPEQYPEARLLLGTIAAAYDNRHRMNRPARVVYANLKAGRSPAQHYLDKPQSYLPADFCRAAGLPSPAQSYAAWRENSEPLADLEPEPEQELDWPLVEPEALEWFRKLIGFGIDLFGWTIHHQYLEDCDLVSCDLEAGEFVLSAEDQLSADWLNARLISKLQNTLAGISGRRLKVRFEVWPPLGEAG
jgi:hypothetical protein